MRPFYSWVEVSVTFSLLDVGECGWVRPIFGWLWVVWVNVTFPWLTLVGVGECDLFWLGVHGCG